MEIIFISREKIRNPLVKDLIEIGKELRGYGTLSARYGNRIIISTSLDMMNLKEDDFVEIVDYNPSTNISLVIGLKYPPEVLPIHWLIYRLENVNFVVHLYKKMERLKNIENLIKLIGKLKERKILHDDILGKIIIAGSLKEISNNIKNIQ